MRGTDNANTAGTDWPPEPGRRGTHTKASSPCAPGYHCSIKQVSCTMNPPMYRPTAETCTRGTRRSHRRPRPPPSRTGSTVSGKWSGVAASGGAARCLACSILHQKGVFVFLGVADTADPARLNHQTSHYRRWRCSSPSCCDTGSRALPRHVIYGTGKTITSRIPVRSLQRSYHHQLYRRPRSAAWRRSILVFDITALHSMNLWGFVMSSTARSSLLCCGTLGLQHLIWSLCRSKAICGRPMAKAQSVIPISPRPCARGVAVVQA